MLRHDERGVLDIELVGFIPALVIVLLFLVLRYRERRRDHAEYGYYPKDEKDKTER